jgi:hypothetical protein
MGFKVRKRHSLLLPGIVAGAFIAVLLLVWFRAEPGEMALVRRFEKNRAAFNELRMMVATNLPGEPLRQDGKVWSMEHYQRYRALLRETGVIRSIQKQNEVRFLIAEPAPGKQGARIAIAWLGAKPDRVLSHVEDFRRTGNQTEQAYRYLAENWYLWIQK